MKLPALRNFYIPAILFFLAIFYRTDVFPEETAFPRETVVLYGNGTSGPYSLGKPFIGGTAYTDTSSQNFAKPSIISSDSRAGIVDFDRPISKGDSVRILFAPVPFWLIEKYERPPSGENISILKKPEIEKYAETTPLSMPGLTFGGSKTFDVSTGSGREASLNQTLRLNITGNVTDDIILRASISDQNTPLSPEGDTRELEEIDRVMIELEGKSFKINMGDTDLKNNMGQWLSYERRLSGANASVRKGNVEIFGSGATSEGKRQSIRLNPVEGNQGPYRLTADNGNTDVSIIPGTEKVWINGEQLVRGSGNDYTIDYSTGELIFTEKRIIGSDMRIICDYEFTSESFLRNFYTAGTKAAFFDSTLSLGFIAAREADNSSKPVFDTIDTETKRALSLSGDSPAEVTGIKPAAGDSIGTYDMNNGILVYNPSGKGSYKASFSWVGESQGSYRYLGGGIYEFVPPEERIPGGGTSYEPVSIIEGSVSHNLAGFTLSYKPFDWFGFDSEIAGSSLDLNTLSSRDDGNNEGGARRITFNLNPELKTKLPLELNLSGIHRSQGKTFSPLDRDRPAEENRRWGLPLITGGVDESINELSTGVIVNDGKYSGSGINFEGGAADFGDTTSSQRKGASGIFKMSNRGETRFFLSRIDKENTELNNKENIDRINLYSGWQTKYLNPSLTYEGEKAELKGSSSGGSLYHDFMTQILTPQIHGLIGEAQWFYRLEQSKADSWRDSSTVRGGSLGFSSGLDSPNVVRLKYGKRERTTGSESVSTDQASMDAFWHPENKPIKLDISYRAGRTREASKRKNFIFAGTGRGNYRWEDINNDDIRDTDEFIPDNHGAYYLFEETLSDYKPLNAVDLFGKSVIEISPGILKNISGIKSKIQLETTFEIDEKSKASSSDVFLLNLSKFRKNGLTSSGDSRIQQDITLPVSGGDGSLRLRYFSYDRFNSEYVTGSERNDETEYSLRLRVPLREETDSEFNFKRAFYKRIMEQRTAGDYDVDSWFGDAGVSAYPAPLVRVGINAGGGRDNDKPTGIRAVYYQLKPSASYQFAGKGKIDVSYTMTSVRLDNFQSGMRLQYTMAMGQKEGRNHEIGVTLDYRLSSRMNVLATYTGRQYGGEKFESFAQAQVRALF